LLLLWALAMALSPFLLLCARADHPHGRMLLQASDQSQPDVSAQLLRVCNEVTAEHPWAG